MRQFSCTNFQGSIKAGKSRLFSSSLILSSRRILMRLPVVPTIKAPFQESNITDTTSVFGRFRAQLCMQFGPFDRIYPGGLAIPQAKRFWSSGGMASSENGDIQLNFLRRLMIGFIYEEVTNHLLFYPTPASSSNIIINPEYQLKELGEMIVSAAERALLTVDPKKTFITGGVSSRGNYRGRGGKRGPIPRGALGGSHRGSSRRRGKQEK